MIYSWVSIQYFNLEILKKLPFMVHNIISSIKNSDLFTTQFNF